jgi:hypothetical protein
LQYRGARYKATAECTKYYSAMEERQAMSDVFQFLPVDFTSENREPIEALRSF